MRSLPALDTHAHIAPSIAPAELERLGSVVFAATRSIGEFESVASRSDLTSLWGLGTHPALTSALNGFDRLRFSRALGLTPLVSEVGLDGSARSSFTRQRAVFSQICEVVRDQPRMVSVHSRGASGAVLDSIEAAELKSGIVLHWWRGTISETARAVDLGCYFSVNASMIPDVGRLAAVPKERLLVETDHPYGDRAQKGARPGNVALVEAALGSSLNLSPGGVRALVWSNLADLAAAVDVITLMPTAVQRMIGASKQ